MSGRRKAIRSSTKPTLFKPRPQSIPETPAGHYLAIRNPIGVNSFKASGEGLNFAVSVSRRSSL